MRGFGESALPRLCVILCLAGVPGTAYASVDLEWRQEPGAINVNDIVRIGLYAVSADPVADEAIAGIDLIFSWDPAYLQFLGKDDNGPYAWLGSYFPANDPFGINEVVPPADGTGLYLAQGQIGNVALATPAGLLVTTFRFRTLAGTCGTEVRAMPSGGSPTTYTVVWSGGVPGTPATGNLGFARVAIEPVVCLYGDMNCDGLLDGRDIGPFILALLDPVAYESTYACNIDLGDMNGDGVLDFDDLQPLIDELLGGCGSLKGDINCDWSIDGLDIALFVDVMLGNDLDPVHQEASDFDGNASIDMDDLQQFVARLTQ